MGCLGMVVALLDVRDVDAFVGAAISRDPWLRRLSGHEREGVECEGYALMYELAESFDPSRGWSFSSYAGSRLARRLVVAWHRSRQGQRRRTGVGERRLWDVGPGSMSFDLVAERADGRLIAA